VAALGSDAALEDDADLVGVDDGGEAVGDHEGDAVTLGGFNSARSHFPSALNHQIDVPVDAWIL
jgi:hypothetical protein